MCIPAARRRVETSKAAPLRLGRVVSVRGGDFLACARGDVMAAYVLGSVHGIGDQARFAEYGQRIGATMEPYGGKFLAAAVGERIEGTAQPLRSVVIEFPDMDALKRWYDSAAYRELREFRRGAVDADILFVEGL
jgi:uncharacterized protein (DUF1330 family)